MKHLTHDKVIKIQQVINDKHDATVIKKESNQSLFRGVQVMNLKLERVVIFLG